VAEKGGREEGEKISTPSLSKNFSTVAPSLAFALTIQYYTMVAVIRAVLTMAIMASAVVSDRE
jgi:hypothetical protein